MHFPGRNRDDEKLIVTIPPIRCGIAPDIRSTAAVTGIREYDERERTEPSLIPIIKTQTPDNYCSGNKNRGTGGHSSERKLHISITERLRSRNFHIRRVRLRLRNAHTISSYHKTLAPREKFHTGKTGTIENPRTGTEKYIIGFRKALSAQPERGDYG